MASSTTKLPVGTVLSEKYRITSEIGRGGMAAVYEAEHIDIGKRVAIKVLAQELTASNVVVERFLREARAAASIRSPYICDVYDSGRLEDGRPFLVLELLEGESLYERMTKVRQLDVDTTLTIMTQICRGLTKAHAASIVHRDLKPENIFLTRDEEGGLLAKLLDFGLAKFYLPLAGGERKQARLTREGAVFGTPAYMSPEQVRGQGAVDHRADLWALGCITYECLTGRTVWQTDQGVAMTFAQIANAPIPSPEMYRPDLPPTFSGWFRRALDRNIENRFQSAKEFVDELTIAFQRAPSSPNVHSPDLLEPVSPYEVDIRAAEYDDDTTRRFSPDGPTTSLKRSPDHAAYEAPMSPVPDTEVPVFMSEPPVARHSSTPPNSKAAPLRTTTTSARPVPRLTVPPTLPPALRRRPGLTVFVGGLLGITCGVGYAVWQLSQTQEPGNASVEQVVTVKPAAEPPPSAMRPAPPQDIPWMPLVRKAQEALSARDPKTATRHLREAINKGGAGVPQAMLDHIAVGASESDSACKLTGISRPRSYDLLQQGRRVAGDKPSIVRGQHGSLVAWTDAHEGNEHVYSVALDDSFRTMSDPFDVTPESTAVEAAHLAGAGNRAVLTYWDAKGPESGVHARWLDGEGRIASASVMVAKTKRGSYLPASVRSPDGSFLVGWSAEDAKAEDVFFRRLSPSLEPLTDEIRATDLMTDGPTKPRARHLSMALQGDDLHFVFRLDREPSRLVQHVRVPVSEALKGLEAPGTIAVRMDHLLGEVALVNTDRGKSEEPSLACGAKACFIAWHSEEGGAFAAYVEAGKTQPLWRKKFTRAGGQPIVAAGPNGDGLLAWAENNRLTVAMITRDGIGPLSKVGRASHEGVRPSLVPGPKAGEWHIAWLDHENGHLEPYAARVSCK